MFALTSTWQSTRSRVGVGFAATWMLLVAAGCHTWAPGGGLPGLAGAASEREIAKLAAKESFPTPAEVGIGDK